MFPRSWTGSKTAGDESYRAEDVFAVTSRGCRLLRLRTGTWLSSDRASRLRGMTTSDLTRDTLVGCGWAGVSFRWYYGVGGLVVGH